MKNFEQFLDETDTHLLYIYEFDRSLCVEFLDYLYFNKDVSAVTRNGYRTWLSTFVSWLIDKEYISKDSNPVADIKQIGYIDITNCIVTLPGKFAKNRKRQEVTVQKKVLKLMIDLGTFNSPSQYYIFGPDLRPSTEQVAVNRFRQEWAKMRKALG